MLEYKLVGIALILLGVGVALPIGARYARAQRGWADYQKAKAAVPVLRKDAWGLIRAAVKSAVGVAVLVFVFLVAAIGNADTGS